MKLAFDVQYYESYAKTVCVIFSDWNDPEPTDIIIEEVKNVASYIPGEFYKRELPCIQVILKNLNLDVIELIIVDGYVHLDDTKKFGLGGYLYTSLDNQIPVIGVAKSGFHNNKKHVRELLRGESVKPLYITAIGIDLEEATKAIQSMHGVYRMPTILQIVDTKTKETKSV
ncbi:endonuclease V [Aquimarina sp. 2201CG5-10]|uniref:endonuclease V n=1 Tax=Aquimarina callyspongiae TaxID=3098150 RepID=UPI002AB43369|nr:endonuclease V [Aquimarina sp. 2201CG5-10]MDY8137307.1 endonuclease V [Aquimarina sp. 2201CG5-10]